ncbi:MAG: NAD-dependent epimerase/dehydratase family protein [Deltaproteobacteria bacterium]
MNPILPMSAFFQTEDELEAALSEPTTAVIETLRRRRGDIILLGVGGKMGLSLARMARRASDAAGVSRRVIGVSRFSAGAEAAFNAHGIETIRCDLLNEDDVAQLPDAENVVFMTGKKFGSSDDMPSTWAMNSYLPAIVCRKFRRSRIVAFSTGNVYGLTPVARGGSLESDEPEPVGEYAMSCLGRERIFEYFSRSRDIPAALIRLNYACDLRYGVLVDLARQVWSGQAVDLTMGHFNTIWQGDANAWMLQAFDHAGAPPWIINVTGPELLSVRAVCGRFGRIMGKPVCFKGTESDTALLSDARRAVAQFGSPRVGADQLTEWVAHWVMRGGRQLGKPTHFESRSGRF